MLDLFDIIEDYSMEYACSAKPQSYYSTAHTFVLDRNRNEIQESVIQDFIIMTL